MVACDGMSRVESGGTRPESGGVPVSCRLLLLSYSTLTRALSCVPVSCRSVVLFNPPNPALSCVPVSCRSVVLFHPPNPALSCIEDLAQTLGASLVLPI